MKNCLYKLLFFSYSTGSLFCKKKNKEQDTKKKGDVNTNLSTIVKEINKSSDVSINNNTQVHSLKTMIENYSELASEFLDNVKAVNYQKSEDSVVNLVCRRKENIDVPKEVDNDKNNSKKNKKKNKKE